jgi:hypothetical protein
MGDVAEHDGAEPLGGIEMRVIGRQLDQMNAAGTLRYRGLCGVGHCPK